MERIKGIIKKKSNIDMDLYNSDIQIDSSGLEFPQLPSVSSNEPLSSENILTPVQYAPILNSAKSTEVIDSPFSPDVRKPRLQHKGKSASPLQVSGVTTIGRLTLFSNKANLHFQTNLQDPEQLQKILKNPKLQKSSDEINFSKIMMEKEREHSFALGHSQYLNKQANSTGQYKKVSNGSNVFFQAISEEQLFNFNGLGDSQFVNLFKNEVCEIVLDQSSFSQTNEMGTLKDPCLRDKYTYENLVQLVNKYEKIQMNINQIEDNMRYTTFELAKEQQEQNKDIKNALEQARRRVFNTKKLRQTIISGVYQQTTTFNDLQIGRVFTKEKLESRDISKKSIYKIDEQPDEDDEQLRVEINQPPEFNSIVENVIRRPSEELKISQNESFQGHLRGRLWKIICHIDDLKHQMIEEHNQDLNRLSAGFGNKIPVKNSKELYELYRNQYDETIDYEIYKDLKRTCIGNVNFLQDPKSGNNTLYNVLNAYAHFDVEINYCQGLNFIVALLLKHLGNEEDSFYCLVHIMKVHGWRGCFSSDMQKLIDFINFMSCVLETAFPKVHQQIVNLIDENLVPVFSPNIQTIFVYDCPEHVATQIFDAFLLDGEQVVFTLLIKMIQLKEEEILKFGPEDDQQLLEYLRSYMILDCLKTYPMTTLLD